MLSGIEKTFKHTKQMEKIVLRGKIVEMIEEAAQQLTNITKMY